MLQLIDSDLVPTGKETGSIIGSLCSWSDVCVDSFADLLGRASSNPNSFFGWGISAISMLDFFFFVLVGHACNVIFDGITIWGLDFCVFLFLCLTG